MSTCEPPMRNIDINHEYGHYGNMKQNTMKIIVGIIIVMVGLNIILSETGVQFTLFFDGWWTLPIIILAVASMLKQGVDARNFGMLLLGSWLLADQRGWIPSWLEGRYIAGAAIIVVGLLFVTGNKHSFASKDGSTSGTSHHDSYQPGGTQADPEAHTPHTHSGYRHDEASVPSYTAIFSGQEVSSSSSNLDGANLFALFGGLTVDFNRAVIDHDIMIDASAFFGGIELRFPRNVKVEVKATPLFGGVENSAKTPLSEEAPVVVIRCLVAFGGVEIKAT